MMESFAFSALRPFASRRRFEPSSGKCEVAGLLPSGCVTVAPWAVAENSTFPRKIGPDFSEYLRARQRREDNSQHLHRISTWACQLFIMVRKKPTGEAGFRAVCLFLLGAEVPFPPVNNLLRSQRQIGSALFSEHCCGLTNEPCAGL